MTKSKPAPGGSSWAPLLVAVGGSVGASLRWGGEELIPAMGGSITQAILVVNLLGAFMLGYVFTRIDARFPRLSSVDLPPNWLPGESSLHKAMAALIAVGLIGAFTTYSSFALWVFKLMEDGAWFEAGMLLGLSLVLGPLAIWAGFSFGERRHRDRSH